MKGKVETELHSILPYIRTSSFAWGPKGQILYFQYNKIDFNQLKPIDKTITNFNNLEDWIKFCKSKDKRNRFSRSENKLIEDDSDMIITEKLRKLVDWKSIKEIDNTFILSMVNQVDSLPNLFINNEVTGPYPMGILSGFLFESAAASSSLRRGSVSLYNLYNDYPYPIDNNSFPTTDNNNETSSNGKKSFVSIHKLIDVKTNFILENLKIKLLSKDHFFGSINFLLQSMNTSDVKYLVDILNMINFNINSIIDPINTSELLVNHYKFVIMTCIRTLEKNKNYEYLYITILLITSRIFDSDIRNKLEIPSLINSDEADLLLKSKIQFKYIPTDLRRKSLINSGTSICSEKIVVRRNLLNQSCSRRNRSSSVQFDVESFNIFDENLEFDLNAHRNDDTFTSEKDNEEKEYSVGISPKLFHGIKFITCNEIQNNDKYKDNEVNSVRNLILVFGDLILSKFIDFLYFYSNELYRMNRMTERAELIKFLFLISSKLKINKFKNIIENSYVNCIPNHPIRNKRVNSVCPIKNLNENESLYSLYNQFKYHDEKITKKFFKTKLLSEEHLYCDICGERLKIGVLTLYSIFYNIKGHYEHVNDFINNNYKYLGK